jgi:hypothetical protein
LIRRFTPDDAETAFVCERGSAQVSFWDEQAVAVHSGNSAAIYVLTGDEHTPIFGYYAICMARLPFSDLPQAMLEGPLPRQCPVALLAQLARHDRAPKGIGAALVTHALRTVVRLSEDIGCVGIILDAEDANLVGYYERFGFRRVGHSKSSTQRMFMSIHRARASLEAVE